ncbi:hypothetical protein ERICIV_02433 [Paenibacillus larvae subsp. larvae]|uniref:Uncharacterized protein n=1 Tax=Paenibacillus larvae subsp. larvae TaxID=147375 RepID=A0A2L1U112_9BACL|nr:hypothetical protein ERICIII_02459 [Paenibacillus larvae subsp. larvae]AVF31343.1 hypothetical protein ERICIV_02433 [Paenibacillus larvae subsp. larvae]
MGIAILIEGNTRLEMAVIDTITSIMIASKKAGNGTSSRCAIKLTRSSDGIIS